jgi:hypothetical protein
MDLSGQYDGAAPDQKPEATPIVHFFGSGSNGFGFGFGFSFSFGFVGFGFGFVVGVTSI